MNEVPAVSVQEMQRLLSAELSLRSRVGYTALLLLALAMTIVVASLWLTEPTLVPRTQIAFAAMIAIGLSWVAYAVWVLTRRRVLLAGHRILSARMAVVFSALFVIGFVAIGLSDHERRAAFTAAGLGVFMLAAAIGLLIRARRQFARLLERRRVLELELGRMS